MTSFDHAAGDEGPQDAHAAEAVQAGPQVLAWGSATPLQRLGLWLATNLGLPDLPTDEQVDEAIDLLSGAGIGEQVARLPRPVIAITSVWSAYGHRFISNGGEGESDTHTESCLTCGAAYDLVPDDDDPTFGRYLAGDGTDPTRCTGNTSMVHGYPGERVCPGTCTSSTAPCQTCNHDCNCLLCQ